MKSILMALLFFGGILLAGSDGAWFPVPNFIGALLLAVFGLIGPDWKKWIIAINAGEATFLQTRPGGIRRDK